MKTSLLEFEIQGVRIEAYKGMHWEIPGEKGIDSMGYLIETGNRRLLFPGDVRRYETGKIPAFENIDHLIAHVWLGRNNGLHPFPSKELEQFARFVISLRPKKVTLAHLYETDRKPEEIWTYIHGGMIMDVMAAMAPEIDVSISRRWSGYSL